MKWDVMHDRAKRVIDSFLSNAEYWQDSERLAEGLTDEEKELVSKEVASMIASIRKRYKLDVRLPQQEAQIQQETVKAEIPTVKPEETKPEPVNEVQTEEKPKRGRKASNGEKKPATRKPRAKKTEKEVPGDEKESA